MCLVMMALLATTSFAFANPGKVIRATELTAQVWSDFERGQLQDLIIEFRQGDRLPVSLQAEGDLMETAEVNPSYIVIKRPFWVNVKQDQILMSLNGKDYKPFKQVIGGTFTVGASVGQPEGGVASAINFLFKAFIK